MTMRAGVRSHGVVAQHVIMLHTSKIVEDGVLTFENSSAGVNSDTLMTLSLRCVALSVTPVAARMYPARHSRKTWVMD